MAAETTPFGPLLRHWRSARRMSQLDVAVSAGVSSRHLSFLETGRAQPSREMIALLASVLDVPLRERNALFQAAGFAHAYRETDLGSAEMTSVRRSLEFLLARHEPYPAVVLDRGWNVQLSNNAAMRMLLKLLPPTALVPPVNAMRIVFDPAGLRPFLCNWDEVAAAQLQWLQREHLAWRDPGTRQLLDEILAFGVPAGWRTPNLGAPPTAIVPLHVKKGDLELRLFTALTTLGTPVDVTAQEIRLETFFPADEATETQLRRAAADGA